MITLETWNMNVMGGQRTLFTVMGLKVAHDGMTPAKRLSLEAQVTKKAEEAIHKQEIPFGLEATGNAKPGDVATGVTFEVVSSVSIDDISCIKDGELVAIGFSDPRNFLAL